MHVPFNPYYPSITIQILVTGLHTFCWVPVGRTFLYIKTVHLILVIMYLILMSCMPYNALIWWGEIWWWSPLGLKGLSWFVTNSQNWHPKQNMEICGEEFCVDLRMKSWNHATIMRGGRQCNVLILWETALIPSPVFLLKLLLAIISTL